MHHLTHLPEVTGDVARDGSDIFENACIDRPSSSRVVDAAQIGQAGISCPQLAMYGPATAVPESDIPEPEPMIETTMPR